MLRASPHVVVRFQQSPRTRWFTFATGARNAWWTISLGGTRTFARTSDGKVWALRPAGCGVRIDAVTARYVHAEVVATTRQLLAEGERFSGSELVRPTTDGFRIWSYGFGAFEAYSGPPGNAHRWEGPLVLARTVRLTPAGAPRSVGQAPGSEGIQGYRAFDLTTSVPKQHVVACRTAGSRAAIAESVAQLRPLTRG